MHTTGEATALINLVEACMQTHHNATSSKLLDALEEMTPRFSAHVCEPPVAVCEVQQQADAPPCAGAVTLQLPKQAAAECSPVGACSPALVLSARSSSCEELCEQLREEPGTLPTPAMLEWEEVTTTASVTPQPCMASHYSSLCDACDTNAPLARLLVLQEDSELNPMGLAVLCGAGFKQPTHKSSASSKGKKCLLCAVHRLMFALCCALTDVCFVLCSD
jgi:hypothetical protein